MIDVTATMLPSTVSSDRSLFAQTACSAGTCVACGAVGQACCAGDTCTAAGSTCNVQSGVCVACGGAGERCCPGDSCTAAGTACDPGTHQCAVCGGQLICTKPGPGHLECCGAEMQAEEPKAMPSAD